MNLEKSVQGEIGILLELAKLGIEEISLLFTASIPRGVFRHLCLKIPRVVGAECCLQHFCALRSVLLVTA